MDGGNAPIFWQMKCHDKRYLSEQPVCESALIFSQFQALSLPKKFLLLCHKIHLQYQDSLGIIHRKTITILNSVIFCHQTKLIYTTLLSSPFFSFLGCQVYDFGDLSFTPVPNDELYNNLVKYPRSVGLASQLLADAVNGAVTAGHSCITIGGDHRWVRKSETTIWLLYKDHRCTCFIFRPIKCLLESNSHEQYKKRCWVLKIFWL